MFNFTSVNCNFTDFHMEDVRVAKWWRFQSAEELEDNALMKLMPIPKMYLAKRFETLKGPQDELVKSQKELGTIDKGRPVFWFGLICLGFVVYQSLWVI